MTKIGFREAKKWVIAALKSGDYQHVSRDDIETKNLLEIGAVSTADLVNVILKCRDCRTTPKVPELKHAGQWYIVLNRGAAFYVGRETLQALQGICLSARIWMKKPSDGKKPCCEMMAVVPLHH